MTEILMEPLVSTFLLAGIKATVRSAVETYQDMALTEIGA